MTICLIAPIASVCATVAPLCPRNYEKIEKVRIGKVRRAKLFFLRGLSGKKARIVEDLSATSAEKAANK